MTYTKPGYVHSPKTRWRLRKVLYDGKELGNPKGGWSAAEGQWDTEETGWVSVLALRWNGTKNNPHGNPQSRGRPTWFIVPEELESAVRDAVTKLSETSEGKDTNG